MSGIRDAVSATLSAAASVPDPFPAVGTLTEMTVIRDSITDSMTAPILGVTHVRVRLDGISYECGVSGTFIAEIAAADQGAVAMGSFIGRRVKVESLGGQILVAYTINWS